MLWVPHCGMTFVKDLKKGLVLCLNIKEESVILKHQKKKEMRTPMKGRRMK